MTDSGSSVRLTIPAKAEYITLGRLALTAIAGVRPLSDETLHDLKLALTEACTNSVRHAYGNGGEGEVEILYELEPDRLVVEVGDAGSGFDPQSAMHGEDGELDEKCSISAAGCGSCTITKSYSSSSCSAFSAL